MRCLQYIIMERKIIEIPKENEGFQRSLGVMHGAAPQNLSLEWPSVWGGKSLKFLRKMKDASEDVYI